MIFPTPPTPCVCLLLPVCDTHPHTHIQVSTKMATFSPRELAGVLVALGHLGYNPGPVWLTQVRVCVYVCVLGGALISV